MLRQILRRLQTAILARPRRVLAGSALLVAVALALGSRVELRTSRSELAPPDDPDQLRWTSLVEEYRGSEALIACVEAEPGGAADAAELRAFVDRLAAEFRGDPRVAQVFHELDTEWLRRRWLYLLPAERLQTLAAAFEAERPTLERLVAADGLAELTERVAERIEQARREGQRGPAAGGQALDGLVALVRFERRFVEDPAGALEALRSGLARPARDGYLTTRDGSLLFLLISPLDPDDSLRARREFVEAMRARAESVRRERPGFRVAFTGQPALVVDEMDTVRRDTWRTSIVAVVGVSALTFLVFRWRSHAVLVLLALGVGLAWSFGAVRIELGYLNLITSSFLSTLVGVGVAYGIHPVSEYELEGAHTRDPVEALRESFHRTGAAVTVAAVTTAAAFLSIRLMRFRGFAELGLVAGIGVLLCLAAVLVTLPAMLVVYGRRRRASERDPAQRPAPAVDRIWVERIAGQVCRAPRAVAAAALLVTSLAAWSAAGLGFDTNILDLLPRNAESLRYQRRMAMESELSPLTNIVVADDLQSLAAMRARAASEPSIARFDSVLQLLPEDPERVQALVAALGRGLAGLHPTPPRAAIERDGLVRALGRLERALADASDDAFGAGLGEVAARLEEARGEAERARRAASEAPPELATAWAREQGSLWQAAGELLDALREATGVEPPRPQSLPLQLRERFVTSNGRLTAFLSPAGSVFDPAQLEEYVAASRRVSEEVTGFPVLFQKMTRRITAGFRRALLVGGLAVGLILLVDYRRPRDVLLALLPLLVGMVWMVGAMRALGLSFHFANLVAIPLILGVGIDNGVHVIHRVRLEGERGMSVVLRHTGRAILIASLTTMIGFGSLSLASHRGLSSLGLVLFLGVGSCLLTSTVVLPNLLVLLGLVRR